MTVAMKHLNALWIVACVAGCDPIRVNPDCSVLLRVGDLGMAEANVVNPGAIARYAWTAEPADAVQFTNSTAMDTTFQAIRETSVRITLTAFDGIYGDEGMCRVLIQGRAPVAVRLSAEPQPPIVNEPVTLTCESIGDIVAEEFDFRQTEGPIVMLSDGGRGRVRFEPPRIGEYVFTCFGISSDDMQSATATLALQVVVDDDNANGNTNGNGNANGNGNLNANANDNADSAANLNDNARDDTDVSVDNSSGTNNDNGS